jgi:hypothetical protein
VQEVSDDFLLNVAEVSATLIGLFLVGVFFYVETGFRRLEKEVRRVFEPYFRSGTRIVLLLYGLPLTLSTTLVVLSLSWNRVFFLLLSALLIVANVDSVRLIRQLAGHKGASVLVLNEIAGTAAVAVLVVLPWALGGFHPSREDLTWAILISLGSGFLSVGALILSVIDTSSAETDRANT